MQAQRDAGRYVPGLGHTLHKTQDPRTPVLYRIAQVTKEFWERTWNCSRLSVACIRRFSDARYRLTGQVPAVQLCVTSNYRLTYCEDSRCWRAPRALLGHIAEEMRNPIGLDLYAHVEHETQYEPPTT